MWKHFTCPDFQHTLHRKRDMAYDLAYAECDRTLQAPSTSGAVCAGLEKAVHFPPYLTGQQSLCDTTPAGKIQRCEYTNSFKCSTSEHTVRKSKASSARLCLANVPGIMRITDVHTFTPWNNMLEERRYRNGWKDKPVNWTTRSAPRSPRRQRARPITWIRLLFTP